VTGMPPIVLPTHWDYYAVPYGWSQEENIARNLVPFAEKAATISPRTRVIIPTHLKTIVIP